MSDGVGLAETLEQQAAAAKRWAARFEWHLDQVPPIMEVLRDELAPIRVARYDAVRVSGTVDKASLPFRVGHVDDANELWATLVRYTAYVASLIHQDPPAGVRATWSPGGDTQGLPASVGKREASFLAYEVIGWLIDHTQLIAPLMLTEYEGYLFRLIRGLRARHIVPVTERPARRRDCDVCLATRSVSVDWVSGVNGRAVRVVVCSTCEHTYQEPDGG